MATVTGISIKEMPTLVIYKEGENLDLTGLEVTLTHETDPDTDVALADFGDNGLTVDPANASELDRDDTEVTITHTDSSETVSFNIEVLYVYDIWIKEPPDKIYYLIGEDLDLTGLVIELVYNDETTEEVAFADFGDNDVTVDPENGATLGEDDDHFEIFYHQGETNEVQHVYWITLEAEGVTIFYPSDIILGPGTDHTGYIRWREGRTYQLVAQVRLIGDPGDDVVWTSSDEEVATISESGVLTALAAGTTDITATSVEDGTHEDVVAFEVFVLDEYITGEKVHKLISAMDISVQIRFVEEMTRRMITIEETSDNLHTAQLALICSVI